uniref:Uncharacterized protein n=1 Tax=Eucampia antarctica TaxID=49252 RepID=A0A7S2S5Z8_9STRA|mmetsp:Transcript_3495/g.3316  ORF Transcript_3495/g.3316 Transcript_3495/m.3316 type:complete len:102 (+) Transcript_3495:739-1044(+)
MSDDEFAKPMQCDPEDYDGYFKKTKHGWGHMFDKKDMKILPLGIQVIVHTGSHYDRLVFRHNQTTPLFWIGTPFPDMLYTLLCISNLKWENLKLADVIKHN